MTIKLSQAWLDEQSKYHKNKEDYEPVFKFAVDVGQVVQLNEWLNEHDKVCPFVPTEDNPFPSGASGGAITVSFTNTSLGQVCKVACACGGEVDLTEYGDW